MFGRKKLLAALLALLILFALLGGSYPALHAQEANLLESLDQGRHKAIKAMVSSVDDLPRAPLTDGPYARNKLDLVREGDKRYTVKLRDDCPLEVMEAVLEGERYDLLGYSDNRLVVLVTDDAKRIRQKAGAYLEWMEEDRVVQAKRTANDEYFYHQWPLEVMEVPDAWDITTGDADISIAVIDSGIYRYHNDLDYDALMTGWDYIENHLHVYGDPNGHGTFVSGIIGASANNLIGIAGLSWNARIVPLRVLDDEGEGYASDAAQAIYDAADAGIRVINLSLGGEASACEEEAVQYALNAGCIIVASAGNDFSSRYNYPASFDGVISVGSTDHQNLHSDFSNHNDQVDFCAPGETIMSISSCGDYTFDSGTSFSAPHVTGLAALALAVNPSLTAEDFYHYAKETCLDLGSPGYDIYHGHGLVQAAALLDAVLQDADQCMVRFDSNQGSEVTAVVTAPGSYLTRPVDPSKAGNSFAGWYKDAALTDAWDFAIDQVAGNMILYARWTPDAPSVQYNYLDENGDLQNTGSNYVRLISQSDRPRIWTPGWYLIQGTVEFDDWVLLTGDVHLILEDNASLTIAVQDEFSAGLNLANGKHLTIYAQSTGTSMGQLTASGHSFGAGIGSGLNGVRTLMTINGGRIAAKGGVYAAGIGGGTWADGGKITINGGEIHAEGGEAMQNGAGIGGGYWASGGEIQINGGKITASGGYAAAGIGGGVGAPAGIITINGGEIAATGGVYFSPGIGGGDGGVGGKVTINGGKIVANGSPLGGVGIGGGDAGSVDEITITGGEVVATGGEYYGAGIGTGGFSKTSGIINISGGTVTATGAVFGAGIGGGHQASGCQIMISGGTVIAEAGGGNSGAAGIGGGSHGSAGDITITGGYIEAYGCPYFAAGIGGGDMGTGGTVTIAGGNVTSVGGRGIGACREGEDIQVLIKPAESQRIALWNSDSLTAPPLMFVKHPRTVSYKNESSYFHSEEGPLIDDENTFSDVSPDAWFFGYVESMVAKGIVSGFKGTDEFRPRLPLTREQASKMVVLAAGMDHAGMTADFDDVSASSWSTSYIAALVAKGAVSGYRGTNLFRPANNIKRSHAAKIVTLAFDLEMGDMPVNLSDLPADPLLADAIRRLASNGIVKGYQGTDHFKPDNEISRAEFSKVMLITMAVSAVQEAEELQTEQACQLAQNLINDLPQDRDPETRAYLQARLDAVVIQ